MSACQGSGEALARPWLSGQCQSSVNKLLFQKFCCSNNKLCRSWSKRQASTFSFHVLWKLILRQSAPTMASQSQQQPLDEISLEAEKNERKIKEKTHDAEAAASLDRVTDYAEEMEISAGDISGLMGLITQEVQGRLEQENQLLKVKIKKEDVELLVRELEMSEEKAERALREHDGNLIEALRTLTN